MSGKFRLLLIVLTSLALVIPVSAHHSFSLEFDQEKPLDLTGSFVRMDWVNPHSWVYIEVENPDGSKTEWGAETPPPNVLYRQGWRKDFFKPGEVLRIEGFAARDGTPHVWASRVFLADGTRVLQMFGGSGPPER
jgi:hypothetical protein